MSIMRYKLLSVPWAFFPALSLLFFGAENGLASQQVRALVLKKCVLVGDGWPALQSPNANLLFHYFIGDAPSYLESFTELQGLNVVNSGPPSYIYDYVPYGSFPLNSGGYRKYPYFYRELGIRNIGTVPDSFSSDDLKNLNNSYYNLPEDQKFGLTGGFTFDTVEIDGESVPVIQFDSKPVGTSTGTGGVYVYDKEGNVVQSFPDGTGYASGYARNADGSYSPVYYKIDGDNITQSSSIPTSDYSSLSYDSNSGSYSLDVPDYTRQLDTIITKIDNIDLRVPSPHVTVSPHITVDPPDVNVNVPPPEITVNPPVVNVSAPEVTVNPTVTAPDVTVNVNTDVSSVNSALSDIKGFLTSDDFSTNNVPDDLSLDSDEQASVNSLRDWETNIPLLGNAVDFGLNSLLGKIPSVGTEYVWMDYTLGSNRRSSKSLSSSLDGYHIRIDLTPYRDTLLAVRGWLIILEALYFILLIYRNIREALQV